MNLTQKNGLGLVVNVIVYVVGFSYFITDKIGSFFNMFSLTEKRAAFMLGTAAMTVVLFIANMYVGGIFLLWTSYMYNSRGHLYQYIQITLKTFLYSIGTGVLLLVLYMIMIGLWAISGQPL